MVSLTKLFIFWVAINLCVRQKRWWTRNVGTKGKIIGMEKKFWLLVRLSKLHVYLDGVRTRCRLIRSRRKAKAYSNREFMKMDSMTLCALLIFLFLFYPETRTETCIKQEPTRHSYWTIAHTHKVCLDCCCCNMCLCVASICLWAFNRVHLSHTHKIPYDEILVWM